MMPSNRLPSSGSSVFRIGLSWFITVPFQAAIVFIALAAGTQPIPSPDRSYFPDQGEDLRWANIHFTSSGSVYAHSHALWSTPVYSV